MTFGKSSILGGFVFRKVVIFRKNVIKIVSFLPVLCVFWGPPGVSIKAFTRTRPKSNYSNPIIIHIDFFSGNKNFD